MKTLIITVGTRQVGWRCRDGIVRSLGADGSSNNPQHIEEIYRHELGIERGYHQDEGSDRTYPWSVWDLGERLYQECQKSDFSNVQLLLDQVIITEQIKQGLNHILLWGTQQPDTVTWSYRRMDTAWLAELMMGKLRETYPDLNVKVFKPSIGAIDVDAIQDQLESKILPFALQTRLPDDDQFTIIIENKGATSAIAEGLSICAGALVRDCQMVTMNPMEPRPLYPQVTETSYAVAPATEYRSVNLGQYFWPLERSRILSAWERGDFAEAKIWLAAHRDRYQILYDLAGYLALASNWQLQDALQQLQKLLLGSHHQGKIRKDLRKQWLKDIEILCKPQDKQTPEGRYLSIWESRLLIYVNLKRQNYTSAFLQFVQAIERLLFWRYRQEDWIKLGYVTPPQDKCNWSVKKYKAPFWDLRTGWQLEQKLSDDDPVVKNLAWMNDVRNDIVHRNDSITPTDFAKVLDLDATEIIPDVFYQRIEAFLQQFCPPDRPMPDHSLLEKLYQWGIEKLKADIIT
ncbi:hypothetical protein [Neosynechococcus sphagnicola]|uniref:hypothetical protein n=1 Tax=Neosynechococcus sphagnicola TaxID=1501145 RepID=UPI0006919A14|nr:hypothetical protein [Neosynechococcus sphagnicola]